MTSFQRRLLVGVAIACVLAAIVTITLVVAGSDDDGGTAMAPSTTSTVVPTTSSPPPSSAPPVPSSAPGATTVAPSCAPGGPSPRGEVAPGAADLDGDGARDAVYMLKQDDPGSPAIGVVLANGHTTETAHTTSIVTTVDGPFDLDGNGRDELLVVASGNTASTTYVQVAVLDGCELVIARNAEGAPYTFLVSDHGLEDDQGIDFSGVGCIDADGDGRLDLVGLAGSYQGAGQVRWTRTIVRLEGSELRNGATDGGVFRAGVDDVAIASLGELSCGRGPLLGPIVSDQ